MPQAYYANYHMYRFDGSLSYGNVDLHDHNGRVIGFFGYRLIWEGSKMTYFVSVRGDIYMAHYDGAAVSDVESYGTRSWLIRVMSDLGITIEFTDRNSVRMF